MAHVVYETVEAVDAVVQIKREEDGEVSWSEPTYCTVQHTVQYTVLYTVRHIVLYTVLYNYLFWTH